MIRGRRALEVEGQTGRTSGVVARLSGAGHRERHAPTVGGEWRAAVEATGLAGDWVVPVDTKSPDAIDTWLSTLVGPRGVPGAGNVWVLTLNADRDGWRYVADLLGRGPDRDGRSGVALVISPDEAELLVENGLSQVAPTGLLLVDAHVADAMVAALHRGERAAAVAAAHMVVLRVPDEAVWLAVRGGAVIPLASILASLPTIAERAPCGYARPSALVSTHWGRLVVAVVIAVVGGGATIAVVRHTRGSPAGLTGAVPTQTAVAGAPQPVVTTLKAQPFFAVHPPPTDRDLIWVQRPQDQIPEAIRVRAFDWDGHELGAISIPCAAPCSLDPAPGGSRLLARPGGERAIVQADGVQTLAPMAVTMFDSSGRAIDNITDSVFGTWADDSVHLCVLRGHSQGGALPFSGTVQLGLLDASTGTTRRAATVAGASSDLWQVAGCSVTSDRAVLVSSSQDGVHAVRVVQLSTGRTLYTRDDQPSGSTAPPPLSAIVVSRNALVDVDVLTHGGAQLRDLSTGALMPWPASGGAPTEVLGLSWMGRRALTDRGLVDVTSGRLVWRAPFASTEIATRPGSDDLLVSVGGRELIVRSDGMELDLGTGS